MGAAVAEVQARFPINAVREILNEKAYRGKCVFSFAAGGAVGWVVLNSRGPWR
ncbi:MAG: hypothetical protein H6R10_582 [Rhodocyclaceae bacterium]|nr:hypothetical protein [Rhodocyclaceae bacterium]